jgi:hypothetical protein
MLGFFSQLNAQALQLLGGVGVGALFSHLYALDGDMAKVDGNPSVHKLSVKQPQDKINFHSQRSVVFL